MTRSSEAILDTGCLNRPGFESAISRPKAGALLTELTSCIAGFRTTRAARLFLRTGARLLRGRNFEYAGDGHAQNGQRVSSKLHPLNKP